MTDRQLWFISIGHSTDPGSGQDRSMTCVSKVISGLSPEVWLLAVERIRYQNAALLFAREIDPEMVEHLGIEIETLNFAVQKLDSCPRTAGWRKLAALRDKLAAQSA